MSTSFLSPASNASLFDAAGRFRVSNPSTRFSGKMIGTDQPLIWSTDFLAGGSATYNQDLAAMLLQVPAVANARAIRQSKRYISYQPGKSQLVDATFVMHPVEGGLIQRVGYFDADNGLFLEWNGDAAAGAEIAFVRRSSVTGSPVDARYPQSTWNIDKMDGSGPSGVTLDLTRIQLLVIDFLWLGAGCVRYGFDIDGTVYYCHEVCAANVLSAVFMSTPTLPIRYEIRTTAPISGPATLYQICSAVASEGGVEEPGVIRSIFRNDAGLSINVAAFEPVLAIRLNPSPTTVRGTLVPQNLSIGVSTSASFHWFLALNPTVTGGAAASWTDVLSSAAQYDIARDGLIDPDTSVIIASGFAATQLSAIPSLDLPEALSAAANIAGVPDELVLAARPVAGSETFFASMAWRESN